MLTKLVAFLRQRSHTLRTEGESLPGIAQHIEELDAWADEVQRLSPTQSTLLQTSTAPRDKTEGRWCPDACPVTGKPFFMWMDHPELGYVPTYGGPYDSYTIAEPDEDGYFRSERYDHDRGEWIEGGAPVHVRSELIEAASFDPSKFLGEVGKSAQSEDQGVCMPGVQIRVEQ